jgi:predicted DNA binding CopG/RHH family protein
MEEQLVEMAKAHLQNVSKEISRLESQKEQIDSEIQRLNDYLKSGVETLEKCTSKKTETVSTNQSPTLFQ